MSLTEFQQKAVCNACRRLTCEGGSGRFLIADEVGLGKTVIAREIIRKFLDNAGKKTFTVVYICSSQLLARKNLKKLVPRGADKWKIKQSPASRLSLLALDDHLIDPDSRKEEGNICYFYALTPGTSLNISQGNGTVQERMMLYLLAGGTTEGELDPQNDLVKKYAVHQDRNGDPVVYSGWRAIYENLHKLRQWERIFSKTEAFREEGFDPDKEIFEQRQFLTRFGASLLKPDLVIFDEFQNYENIFIEKQTSSDEEKRALSAELDIINTVFARLEPKPKYLLLSATPFAPLTMNDEISRGEVKLSSCVAFTRLVEWLSGSAGSGDFGRDWREYSEQFEKYCRGDASFESVAEKKGKVEQTVRSVMSRTERPADLLKNLVQEIDKKTTVLTGADPKKKARLFLTEKGHDYTGQLLAFEKYALRPLSAMRDDYTFIKREERNPEYYFEAGATPSKALEKEMDHPYFQRLLRALGENGDAPNRVDYSLLFWVPPTVPFYELKEPFASAHKIGFSKILIFSSWRYIPRVISAALSNHVERKILGDRNTNSEDNRAKVEAYHFFDSETDQFKAEPLLDADYGSGTSDVEIFSSPAKSVRFALRKLFGDLDDRAEVVCKIWSTRIACALIRRILRSDGKPILKRTWDILKRDGDFRRLFGVEKGEHVPWEKLAGIYCYAGCFAAVAHEYLYLLRQESHAKGPVDAIKDICRTFYLSLKLRVHPIQLDFKVEGKKEPEPKRINLHFADCFSEREKNPAGTVPNDAEGAALPRILKKLYGVQDDSAPDDEEKLENAPIRNDVLQSAFNSPFRPFVLTTTSVGQEGLDFHWYCRKIMHWNLPGNPAAFDQREGRINRFGSFALRQTLTKGEKPSPEFSWTDRFRERAGDDKFKGMVPRWLPPPEGSEGPDRRIERIVPFFPLSREHLWLADLIKLQGIYRMVIGQPRQEELLSLIRSLSPEEQEKIRELIISLAPACPLDGELLQE